MKTNPAVACARCNLRIAPYDLLTVYHGTNYHQDCFLKLVWEEADQQKRCASAGNDRHQSRSAGSGPAH